MRYIILGVLTTVFGAFGLVALFAGAIVTAWGFAEDEQVIGSWLGAYAGFALIAIAMLMFIVSLLAYIANILAEENDRRE